MSDTSGFESGTAIFRDSECARNPVGQPWSLSDTIQEKVLSLDLRILLYCPLNQLVSRLAPNLAGLQGDHTSGGTELGGEARRHGAGVGDGLGMASKLCHPETESQGSSLIL